MGCVSWLCLSLIPFLKGTLPRQQRVAKFNVLPAEDFSGPAQEPPAWLHRGQFAYRGRLSFGTGSIELSEMSHAGVPFFLFFSAILFRCGIQNFPKISELRPLQTLRFICARALVNQPGSRGLTNSPPALLTRLYTLITGAHVFSDFVCICIN